MIIAPVSVVIPSYNASRWIRAAIDSVLRQTHPPRQIIVVDDGSTDGTNSRIEPYGNCIEYIRQENQGVSAARNRGVAAATSEFVAFLDADDVWHPRKLQMQMAVCAAAPDLVLLGTSSFEWPQHQMPDADVQADVRRVSSRQLMVKNHLVTSSVVVRREPLRRAGQFDLSLQGPEDRDLWLRIVEHGMAGVLEAPLTGYRAVEGSVSRNGDRCYAGMMKIIAKLDERDAWNGDWMLRRKALAHIEHSAAWIYGAAGQRAKAMRMICKSMLLYPLPFQRCEISTVLERPKRLLSNLLRILHLKSSKESGERREFRVNARQVTI